MHMERRLTGFFFRVRVPSDLTSKLGIREIRRALETSVPSIAMVRCAELYLKAHQAFERIRRMIKESEAVSEGGEASSEEVSYERLSEMLHEMIQINTDNIESFHSQIESLTLRAKLAELKLEKFKLDHLEKDSTHYAMATNVIDNASALIEQLDTTVTNQEVRIDEMDREATNNEIQRRHIDNEIAQKEKELELREVVIENPTAADVILKLKNLDSGNSRIPTAQEYLDKNYSVELASQKSESRRHISHHIMLFIKICGDRKLNHYKREDVFLYVRTLEQIHNKFGKSAGDFDKPVSKIIKEGTIIKNGEKIRLPTLSEKTIKAHRVDVQAFFKSAIANYPFATKDEISTIFAHVKLGPKTPKAAERKVWEPEALTKLFQTPIWTGCVGPENRYVKRKIAGKYIFRDSYWWLPIMALHTGARLEELAQLQNGDLKQDEKGIWYIEISEAEKQVFKRGSVESDVDPKSLKTESSNREVPVHQFLIDLGFLDLFNKTDKRMSGKRIFQELSYKGQQSSYSQLYSQHFGEYRKYLSEQPKFAGLYQRWMDFHSFRTTFITILHHTYDVELIKIARIVGHDLSEPVFKNIRQTTSYSKAKVSDMKKIIDKLNYESLGVDFSTLK